MALPGVAPVSGRSGADVGATLADPTAPVVVPVPSVVAEQTASFVVGVVQPAEGRVSPTEVVATALSQAQPNATTVVLEGAVQSVPLGAQVDPPMTL